MNQVWLYALASVVGISILSLLALWLIAISENFLRRATPAMMSLAVGAMLGDVFLHLLPELYAKSATSGFSNARIALGILGGILLFYFLELIIRRHHNLHHVHAHPPHTPHFHHADSHILPATEHLIAPVGYVSLIAGSLHNIMDGVLIAGSYMTDLRIGIATTIAVVLHELPHEIGGFGVLIHAGFARRKALTINFLTGCLAIIGVIISLVAGGFVADLPSLTLPLTTGGFIYIAAANLLPELAQNTRIRQIAEQLAGIIFGIGIMWLLTWIS